LFLKSFANAKASDLANRYREHSASGLQVGDEGLSIVEAGCVRQGSAGRLSSRGAASLAMDEYRFESACTSTATNISTVKCRCRC
jgi:hypothetical protein